MNGKRFNTLTDTAIYCQDKNRRADAVDMLVEDYEKQVDELVEALSVCKTALDNIAGFGPDTPIARLIEYAKQQSKDVDLSHETKLRLNRFEFGT